VRLDARQHALQNARPPLLRAPRAAASAAAVPAAASAAAAAAASAAFSAAAARRRGGAARRPGRLRALRACGAVARRQQAAHLSQDPRVRQAAVGGLQPRLDGGKHRRVQRLGRGGVRDGTRGVAAGHRGAPCVRGRGAGRAVYGRRAARM
jgi:hypothetical protein